MISFELLPYEIAMACPVGEGRNEPNIDPTLPSPTGRFQWTWNPMRLLAQTVGPEIRYKVAIFFCCALCIFLLLIMFPLFLEDAIVGIFSMA